MKFTLNDIAAATGGNIVGDGCVECDGVSIDTRKISSSDIFVAIAGPHFDGHDFLDAALGAGANALVACRGTSIPDGASAVVVDDTIHALGDMAAWWRNKFNVPCVAITGSNGKSTTKEMATAVLASLGPVLKTEGNFNNLIGLPLTIFRWNESHRVAVLEMGMNAPGEIRRLAEIARPDVGVITNVTAAHLEKLHSIEAVASAKGELFEAMGPDAVAIINDEDVWVKKVSESHAGPKVSFGMQNNSDVRFLNMESDGLDSMDMRLEAKGIELCAHLSVPGVHNVMNALAAISVGMVLGVEPSDAVESLSKFHPMSMRFERVQLCNGVRVVNDSYNANPESMLAAFRTVGSAKRAGRFIAALGDMFELGDAAKKLHEGVGSEAVKNGVEKLYLVGEFSGDVAKGAIGSGMNSNSIVISDDTDTLGCELEKDVVAGDVLLVKGSRGARMERVVEHMKRIFGTG
jgi:UDP-N-acetylmuramoyl-tripeptide--D-alanyl-D-alanine ligase